MKRGNLVLSLFLISILFISGCETQFSGRSCSIENCDSPACLEIQNVDTTDNDFDVCITNNLNLGGFQFEVLGVEITGAGGGISADQGFTVTSSPSTNMVLGFSLSGAVIPVGHEVLTTVNFSNFENSICFGEVVISDSVGVNVNTNLGVCYCSNGEIDLGCGCDQLAPDCTGLCGGNAVVDECGVCGGAGISPNVCDCNGNVLDCAGECGGSSELDECDICNADSTNDCVQDCANVWGGIAWLDNCGTCDDDPSNNCVQDCAGEWGGSLELDNCGTCDDNSSNNCLLDCEGDPDGDAELDVCGVCDGPGQVYDCGCNDISDEYCNCEHDVLDCAGVCSGESESDCLGDCNGDSIIDFCGVCDDDSSNDCVQDCAGVWGGNAWLDNCGICDNDFSNNCVQDCADNWGGSLVEDCTGECGGSLVEDCMGVCGGDLELDSCGYCNGYNCCETFPELDIEFGDANGDGGHNVMDVQIAANCVLAENCNELSFEDEIIGCNIDMNQDYDWNVLDVTILTNCVLADNCGECTWVDDCGFCEGPGEIYGNSGDCCLIDVDCSGVCEGDKLVDICGTCDNNPSNDCVQDCANVWGGSNICGCTDSESCNYDPDATSSDGSCEFVDGCGDCGGANCCEFDGDMGDLNGDGGHNVLDLVSLIHCVLAENCGCNADTNGDGGYNVFDIIVLATCVLAETCS